MKYEVYEDLRSSEDYSIFDFISTGKKGSILKRIEFTATDVPGFYNLAFGDIDPNGQIDDYKTSDNGDRNKILATIVYAVDLYLSKYPERWVYFRGSTEERTRLYRMAISLHLEELSLRFEIYAEHENGLAHFKKDCPIKGLLVRKK